MHISADSLFLRSVNESLQSFNLKDPCLHVSVTKDVFPHKRQNGEVVAVRWMCWTIEENGQEVTPINVEILSPGITIDVLKAELPVVFNSIKTVIDHDIIIGD